MIFTLEFEAYRDTYSSYIKNSTFKNSFTIFSSVVSSLVDNFLKIVYYAIVGMLSSQLFPPRSPHSKSSKTGSFDKPAFINMKKKTVMLSRYKCKTLRMTVNTKITIKTLFSVSNFHFCNEDMGSVTLPPCTGPQYTQHQS